MKKVLDKISGMRGMLWRKMKEEQKEEVRELPGFEVKKPKTFVELPELEDPTKVNVKYPLILPFAYVRIHWDSDIKQLRYMLQEPELTEEEVKLYRNISTGLIDLIEIGLTSIKQTGEANKYLQEQLKKVLKESAIRLTDEQYIKISYFIYRDFVGLNQIEAMLGDPWIEDIGCDGVGIPIYVVHRKYGSLKTNIAFNDLEDLREFVIKLSERCGRYVSYAEPILDGTLPDGSRVNASLAGDVTTRGPTFSIRKFSERPFSPIDLIDFKTLSPVLTAYFWYLVDSGISLLIAGGVATGKTTLLNSISMFIPPEAKIVSIEDTRELRIPHEHWIPAVTRLGFGIPMSTGEKYGEITLFDLLKGSFRQNPDYVIVGEVRGKEAYVMFQGMSSGHPSMGTFHAGSVDTVIKRLTTPPIELAASLVESLDVIIIMVHAKEKGKSARRIREIEEVISVNAETLRVDTFRISEWDPRTDKYSFNPESILLKKIAHNKGIEPQDIYKEIARRKVVIEWMVKKEITDFEEVSKLINEYYKNPEKILKQAGGAPKSVSLRETITKAPGKPEKVTPMVEKAEVAEEVEEVEEAEEAPEKKKKPKKRKTIISQLFGFKVIGE